jgi:hypothetical protein
VVEGAVGMTEKMLLFGYSVNVEPEPSACDCEIQREIRYALGDLLRKCGSRLVLGGEDIDFGFKNEIRIELRKDKFDRQFVLVLKRIE